MDQLADTKKTQLEIQKIFRYRYTVSYNKKTKTLNNLCDKYGSDKGTLTNSKGVYTWPAHNYCDYYENLFLGKRLVVKKVFECGIGTNNENMVSNMTKNGKPGASLRVWKEFFPNAEIYGADIDREILFSENRIYTDYIDQTSTKSVAQYWDMLKIRNFDLMIDDGLHTFSAGKILFEGSIEYLADDGVYVIEDVSLPNLLLFKKYFDKKKYHVEYINFFRDAGNSLGDNSLIVIRQKSYNFEVGKA